MHKNDSLITKTFSIKEWPPEERPREKLLKSGSDALSDAELMAILIETGIKTKSGSYSAIDIAKKMLKNFGSLSELASLSAEELALPDGIGRAKAAKIIAAIEIGRRIASHKKGNNVRFRCSEEVANYYIPLMKDLKKEQFKVILLDVKNKIIKDILVSQGSLTSSIVHPREVLKPAIQSSAASVIFIHNHPSGDPEPSTDDIEITNRLSKSCSIIGINMLDHIIVAENGYYSFRQKDLL